MSGVDRMMTCPDCGHDVLRPSQDRCTECGLQWEPWLDHEGVTLGLRMKDWFLLLILFPIIASILPILSGRGAIMGARSFEASYLLTIPGFAGIIYLSFRYAKPLAWRCMRRSRQRTGTTSHPGIGRWLPAMILLLFIQVLVYLVVIRLSFVFFIEPLRPKPPTSVQSSSASVDEASGAIFHCRGCSHCRDGGDCSVLMG